MKSSYKELTYLIFLSMIFAFTVKHFELFKVNANHLNHSIKDGWEEYPEGISLSRKLDNCMRIKPETKIRLEHKFGRSEVGYEVLETYKIDKGKDLAPYIKIKFGQQRALIWQ